MTDAPKKIVSRPKTTETTTTTVPQRTMADYLQRSLTVTLTDGRILVGRFVAFDTHMNIVLAQAREYPKGAAAHGDQNRRNVGLVMIRGEHVVNVTAAKHSAQSLNAKANAKGSSTVVPGAAVAKTSEPNLPKASGARRQRNEDE